MLICVCLDNQYFQLVFWLFVYAVYMPILFDVASL